MNSQLRVTAEKPMALGCRPSLLDQAWSLLKLRELWGPVQLRLLGKEWLVQWLVPGLDSAATLPS